MVAEPENVCPLKGDPDTLALYRKPSSRTVDFVTGFDMTGFYFLGECRVTCKVFRWAVEFTRHGCAGFFGLAEWPDVAFPANGPSIHGNARSVILGFLLVLGPTFGSQAFAWGSEGHAVGPDFKCYVEIDRKHRWWVFQ